MAGPAKRVRDMEVMLVDQSTRHGKWFFRLAHGVLRDAAAAEDVCQQAFLKAWEAHGQIQDRLSLKAWLARVIINESLAIARRRKSERHALETYPRDGDGNTRADEPAGRRDGLCAALDELPELTRIVVVLRLFQGMSGNEVKALLGCSASEVSRRLHAGMECLRLRLGGEPGPSSL